MKKTVTIILITLFMVCAFCLAAQAGDITVLNASAPGERVDIANYIETGKTTIFDFYADWCGPCMKIAPYLEKLNLKDEIVVYKVNIKNWGSPVCKQYNINSVPNFKIYGTDGKLKYEGKPAYEKVLEMVEGL